MSVATEKKPPVAERIFAIEGFVVANRAWIMSEENPKLTDIRRRAETSLGYRVSNDAIKACMAKHKIPVRRSAAEAELLRLKEQNETYRKLILRIASYTNLPASIATAIKGEMDLNAEIADALKLNRV